MRFSVCIPIYNVEPYLKQCLDSVMAQTLEDFEAILVDDGTQDNSGVIADEYRIKDSRFKVIHQKNTGLFHARMTALNAAVGEYVVHLDSDDWLEADALEKISQGIDKYGADIVIYNYYKGTCDSDKKAMPCLGDSECVWSQNKDEIINIYFSTQKVQPIWGKAIRRSIVDIDSLSGYPRISLTEDWIHSYYPMVTASIIAYIPDALYNYRITPGSMCKVFDPLIYDSTKIIYRLQKKYIDSHSKVRLSISPEEWLLQKIAKALVYNLAEIKNKDEYCEFLSRTAEDEEVKAVYKSKHNIAITYRLPLILLYSGAYGALYIMRKTVFFVRKHLLR